MRDEVPMAEMLEVVLSGAPLAERAQGLVETLDRWLPVDAIRLTVSDPGANAHVAIGSSGLEQSVLDSLDPPSAARDIQLAELDAHRPPGCVRELPDPVEVLRTWAECLLAAGFREGLVVPLVEPGGPYVGMLSLLFSRAEPPSRALRDRLGRLAPLIALGISPLRSLAASAHLVEGTTAGVALFRDGTAHPLPGLEEHPLLATNSVAVQLARHALLTGQLYRSFMWPAHDAPRCSGHVRMTVLTAVDVPPFVLGTLLMTSEVDSQGLTARELEVLGLVIAGCSNQQIAQHLVIAFRTVATHMEHILHKLEVPTRTLAALRAERQGWYVPPRQLSMCRPDAMVTVEDEGLDRPTAHTDVRTVRR